MPAPEVWMQPLIEPRELAERLAETVVFDVRWRLGGPSMYAEFLDGHLPGACWTDLDADFADPPGRGGRHPLPDPERLQRRLRELGLDDGARVVVYDHADSTAAARAWWVLRWAGLSAVRVLDGGLAAWAAAGGVLETGPARPRSPGTVTVRPGAMPVLDADAAAKLAHDGVLLDARAAPRYRGEIEPIDPVAGHIPGARNAPTTANVRDDGRFLAPGSLRRRFAALGVADQAARTAADDSAADARGGARAHPGPPGVGAYCGSGVTAAHTVLSLEVAGVTAALYPGSWSEWITDPSRRVATGDEQ
jgi:thiosulfate/3-mercaptopyruvate sulfurtransferase